MERPTHFLNLRNLLDVPKVSFKDGLLKPLLLNASQCRMRNNTLHNFLKLVSPQKVGPVYYGQPYKSRFNLSRREYPSS